APPTRSSAPRSPLPSACDACRPKCPPNASPSPTRPSSTDSTITARTAAGMLSRKGVTAGRIASPVRAATAAPASPRSWGRAPDRTPSATARTSKAIATRSRGFTAGSCHSACAGASQATARSGAGLPRGLHRCTAGRLRDVEADRGRVALGGDRPGPGREDAEVNHRGLELGDVDARHVAPARPLDHGELDGLRGLVLLDPDRIQSTTGCDPAPPAELGAGSLGVRGGPNALDAHRMLVDQVRRRGDELRLAEDRVETPARVHDAARGSHAPAAPGAADAGAPDAADAAGSGDRSRGRLGRRGPRRGGGRARDRPRS